MGKKDAITPVCILFLYRGPSTVFRGVRSIVVHPVHRMLRRWFWSHVAGKSEHGSRPFPPGADGYSPSTVPIVVIVGLVVASAVHTAKSYIQRVTFNEHSSLHQGLSSIEVCGWPRDEFGIREQPLAAVIA